MVVTFLVFQCSDLTEILTSLGEKLDEEETKEFMLLADLDGDGNGNCFMELKK